MSQQVEFEGKIHEFPDDASQAEIAKALGGGSTPQPNTVTAGYQKYIGEPLATGVRKAGQALDWADRGFGMFKAPEGNPAQLQQFARDVTPQTPLQAGAAIGTGVAGGLASRFGSTGLPAALWRVLGGAVGGEAGGQVQGAPTGQGALLGGGPAAIGEGVGGIGGKVLRSLPGAKGRIAGQDAAALGGEIGRQSPPLAGASTAGELRTMAAGPGREALGTAKEQAITQIESMLPPSPTINVPTLGGPMSLRDANNKLSEIGARAFSKNPLERNILGVDQRQLYGQAANEIDAALPQDARPLWQTAQADYKKGLALLKPLQSPSAFRQYPDEVQLNTPKLQEYVANPKNEAALRNKLGDQGYEALVNVLTRGGGAGTRDILAPGQGRVMDALLQTFGRGQGGATQFIGAPLRTALPNVGSQYAGRAPYSLPPALQSVLDIALQQKAASP
jgi:hypothetical protein